MENRVFLHCDTTLQNNAITDNSPGQACPGVFVFVASKIQNSCYFDIKNHYATDGWRKVTSDWEPFREEMV